MSNQESINRLWFLVMPVLLLLVVFGFLIINIISSNTVFLITRNNYLGTGNFAYGQQQEEQQKNQIQLQYYYKFNKCSKHSIKKSSCR